MAITAPSSFPDIATMLKHIQEQLPWAWRLVTGGSFLLGIGFAMKSIYKFKEYGELRVMMSANTDLKRPLTDLIVAIILLWAPFLATRMLNTVFQTTTPTIFSYPGLSSGSHFAVMVQIMGDIFELLGFIAFIRGWMLLARATQQGGQPGAFGKALTHIIGGIFAMNIFGAWNMIRATIGWHTGG